MAQDETIYDETIHDEVTIDLGFAKNALFVRQTTAVAFGIPLGREFTWSILREESISSANIAAVKKICIRGFSGLSLRLPDEAKMFMGFLQDLKAARPDIEVMIVICD
jgi:hypothetical protein